jgi:hypothetical protein
MTRRATGDLERGVPGGEPKGRSSRPRRPQSPEAPGRARRAFAAEALARGLAAIGLRSADEIERAEGVPLSLIERRYVDPDRAITSMLLPRWSCCQTPLVSRRRTSARRWRALSRAPGLRLT